MLNVNYLHRHWISDIRSRKKKIPAFVNLIKIYNVGEETYLPTSL